MPLSRPLTFTTRCRATFAEASASASSPALTEQTFDGGSVDPNGKFRLTVEGGSGERSSESGWVADAKRRRLLPDTA